MSAMCQPSLEPAVPLASVAPATCPFNQRDPEDASGSSSALTPSARWWRTSTINLGMMCLAGPCAQRAATWWRAPAWAVRSTAWNTPTAASPTRLWEVWGAASRSDARASASASLPSSHRGLAAAPRNSARQVRIATESNRKNSDWFGTEETNRKSQFMAQEVSSREQHRGTIIHNRLLKVISKRHKLSHQCVLFHSYYCCSDVLHWLCCCRVCYFRSGG